MPDLDNLTGVQGEGFGLRAIVSDVSGVFGEGFGFSANSFLLVTDAYGLQVHNIDFTISWNGGQENVVGYDPAFLYLKNRVTGTLLTVVFVGNALYLPFTTSLAIPAGEFRRIDLLLAYKASPRRIDLQYY